MELYSELIDRAQTALNARSDMLQAGETNALRLFNGFYEGAPGLVADLYDRTLVLFDHRDALEASDGKLGELQHFYLQNLPTVNCVLRKIRNAPEISNRNGILTFGEAPAESITEFGVHYAVNLQLNRDASFYLDTRLLRRWLLQNSRGVRALNCFAYTGSLGVAALAGGAYQVVQTDRSRIFLDLARNSCRLNALEPGGMSFHIQDFFPEVSQLKRRDERFDLVLLDPPFFSVTERGRVDLQAYSVRLINKVRPLVNHEGRIVLINNSLYLSGSDFLRSIDELCADGYLALEESIPVPYDVTGWPSTLHGGPPVSPAPFNHPTKIIVLKVKRKDGNTGM